MANLHNPNRVAATLVDVATAASGTPAAGTTVLGLIGAAVRRFTASLMYDTWLGGISHESGQTLGSHLASLAVPVQSFGCVCDGVDIDDTAAGLAIATTVGTALTVTGDDIFRSGIENASVASDKTVYIVGNDGLVYTRTITARSDSKNVTISSAMPADVSGAVFRLGAAPQGVTILGGSLTTVRLPTNYAPFVAADVGKLIQVDCASSTGGVHRSTIATIVDSSTVTITDAAPGAVSWQPWGYGTDDATSLNYATQSGKNIYISGILFCSTPINISSNTTIHCDARIRLHDSASMTSAGGWLLVKHGARNFKWVGGIIDCAGVVNCNIFAVGDVPNTNRFVENIYLTGFRLKRARVDTTLESSSGTLFAGGGKGITVQFRAKNVMITDFACEDCDIGVSIECAYSDTRYLQNIQLANFRIRNSQRTAIYLQGALASTILTGSSGAEEFEHSKYPGVKIDSGLLEENAIASSVTVPGVGSTNTYDTLGIITLVYPLGVRMRSIDIRQTTRATIFRGNANNCRFEFTATIDSLQDVWNSITVPTFASTLFQPGNVMHGDVRCKSSTTFFGTTYRGYQSSGSNSLIESELKFVLSGFGPTQLSASNSIGTRTWYEFTDRNGSVARKIVGNGSTQTAPSFAITSATGVTGSVQGTVIEYFPKIRHSTATPAATVTPVVAGELLLDTTNKILYCAAGATSADWVALN